LSALKIIKTYLNLARAEKIYFEMPKIKLKWAPTSREALTISEFNTLKDMYFTEFLMPNIVHHQALEMFLFACSTGLRISDIKKVDKSHIEKGFINITAHKTRKDHITVNIPLNKFTLQKPESLMESFARRITPTEIRFPWAIPNINEYTNFLYLTLDGDVTEIKVSLPAGFYTPTELAVQVTKDISGAAVAAGYTAANCPTVAWEPANFQFVWTCGNVSFTIYPFREFIADYDRQYALRPSLLRLMGVPFNSIIGPGLVTPGSTLVGNTTFAQYTDFIDIVSDKLNYNTDVRDGYSGTAANPSLILRLYLADEVSVTQTVPTGCRPFLIHRQFKNAKAIKWNPESMIDWLDIKVIDQYGNLVPLIDYTYLGETIKRDYPNFQITLVASEN
jgi:hypothetical protein